MTKPTTPNKQTICDFESRNPNRIKIVMSANKKQKTGTETFFCHTRFVECKGSQIWKIEGFLTKCPLQNGEFLESSKFNVPGCEGNFFMTLYPKGETNDDIGVSLFIRVVEGQPLVTCKFALVDIAGREVNKRVFNRRIHSKGRGYADFISRDELEKQKHVLLPDDELTVSCVVTIYGEAKVSSNQCGVPSTGGSSVLDDLATLLDRKEGADVVLKVGSDSVPAHKTVLMCRSTMFASMLECDLREGNTGEIQVENMELDVLLALLSFMYSDQLSVADVGFALKLLVAADTYAVPLLQRRIAEYLVENLSADNVLDVLLVADACRCKELSQKCVRLIENEMPFVTDIVTKLDESPSLIGVIKEHLEKELNTLKRYTVDEAVNQSGYGRFQLRLTLLCGLGWTADSFEIIILSIIGDILACDWVIAQWQKALLTSVVFMGMMAGCPVFGIVADRYGRKRSLSVSMVLLFAFGSLSAASPSYAWMLAFRAITGFALGGVAQVMTLCSEFFPTYIRAKASFYICYFWSAGTVGVILLAWVVMTQLDNWRVLLVLTALPALVVVLSLWWYPESARYLLVSGQHEKAEAVLHRMASENGREPPQGRLVESAPCGQLGRMMDLFSRENRMSTLLFWWIWFAVAFSYYGMALMSPYIVSTGELRKTGNSSSVSLMSGTVPCLPLTNANYIDLLWTSSAEFPGLVVFTFLVELCDRKKLMGCSCILSGIFVLLLLINSSHILRLVFLFAARATILAIFQLVIVMTSEAFPTTVRALAVGMGSALCRLGGLLSPYIGQVLVTSNPEAAVSIFAATLALGGVAAFFLPHETRGAAMIDTHEVKSRETTLQKEPIS